MTDILEIEGLVDGYHRWLRDKSALRAIENSLVEITTPFLDRHNDYIQIYANKVGSHFTLTDAGETLSDLKMSGLDLNTPKRQELFGVAIRGFGVDCNNDRLEVRASAKNFALRKHALIQAILAVNDLFYTQSAYVRSFFKEDVAEWLKENDVRFASNVSFIGRSGYTFSFDFLIPESRNSGERILKVINNPNSTSIKNAAFSWLDTRDSRPPNATSIVILNDSRLISDRSDDALREYDITPIRWHSRDQFIELLAA